MPRLLRLPQIALLFSALALMGALITPARAADRDQLEAFLEVTGFDVALESIRLSADSAPAMLGIEANDFGSEWQRLVREVFATDVMHEMAVDILAATLSDDLLSHAAEFYASDLGQRLVVAENKSHMVEDDADKSQTGADILAGLERIGSDRPDILRRLNNASNTEDNSIRAIQEVQVRFMMAAAAAGVIELRMEEPDLREVLRLQEDELRAAIAKNAIEGAAYTYQAFSDGELASYADALEHPKMRDVYALMNAVQFEVMANRYEAVAVRLSGMQPSQDL